MIIIISSLVIFSVILVIVISRYWNLRKQKKNVPENLSSESPILKNNKKKLSNDSTMSPSSSFKDLKQKGEINSKSSSLDNLSNDEESSPERKSSSDID